MSYTNVQVTQDDKSIGNVRRVWQMGCTLHMLALEGIAALLIWVLDA